MSQGPANDTEAVRAAEVAARTSYGRLVAYLAARSRDVASAEDALDDAFVAALETWPRTGVPDNPEAWLLAVARRRLIDAARHASVQAGAAGPLRALVDQAQHDATMTATFPDERLKLLFVCAHPAIDEAVRTPLMLQTVLGLDAALAEARGSAAGLRALETIPPEAVASYQPYWALRAHLLRSLGRAAEARQAYARAVDLSEDDAVWEFLTIASATDS